MFPRVSRLVPVIAQHCAALHSIAQHCAAFRSIPQHSAAFRAATHLPATHTPLLRTDAALFIAQVAAY